MATATATTEQSDVIADGNPAPRNEWLMKLSAAAQYLSTSITTVSRMVNRGHNGVRLQVTMLGAEMRTKQIWIDEYLAAIQPPNPVTDEVTDAKLAELGLNGPRRRRAGRSKQQSK